MSTYRLQREQWLPRTCEEIFPFFADARNLGVLTPDWLDFEILTPMPLEMKAGTLIDYRIRIHGFPLRWRTLIKEWQPPFEFVDVQLKGPYSLWHHRHRFVPKDGGTLCIDEIDYRPIGGALINRLFVRKDVERIFAFREQKMAVLFGGGDTSR